MTKEEQIKKLRDKILELTNSIEEDRRKEREKKVELLKGYTNKIYCYDSDLVESGTFSNSETLDVGYVSVKEVLKIIEKSKQSMIAAGWQKIKKML